VQAIVNLAGEPIAKRWTQARRAAIRDSRVQATTLLARTVAAMAPRPALISGSAVGYYGDRGDEWLDETSTAGRGFLAEVCMDWERATEPAVRAGARVVLLRTGVVMARDGGALAKLLPPFRMGFGGPLGDGRQWTSWIVLEDVLRAIELALQTNALHGPMNLVAPNPVTNAELTSVLGRVLARPALLPVPRVALQLLYGEMADAAILASQRVAPRALAAAGFTFSHPTLEQALRSILER
jgi:TIGR01777 family protein